MQGVDVEGRAERFHTHSGERLPQQRSAREHGRSRLGAHGHGWCKRAVVCGGVGAATGGELFIYASRNANGELWAHGCGESKPLEEAEAAIRELHPYELPEIISVPVGRGHDDYLQWVASETTIAIG